MSILTITVLSSLMALEFLMILNSFGTVYLKRALGYKVTLRFIFGATAIAGAMATGTVSGLFIAIVSGATLFGFLSIAANIFGYSTYSKNKETSKREWVDTAPRWTKQSLLSGLGKTVDAVSAIPEKATQLYTDYSNAKMNDTAPVMTGNC